MSDHPEDGPPNESSSNAFEKNRRGNDGMQRRDLLLGGSSLAAMTALAATAPATAQVQQAAPAPAAAPASTGPKLGEILPFPQPPRPVITEPDWRKVPQPKPVSIRPPKGAPNILVILQDQTSYADPSTFGGPINFPTMDRLAKEGLTYTNFHVNSLCSPSRTALLTGRNQHQNSQAAVVDGATSYPGDTGMRPKSVAPIAEILRQWGYCTSMFGKSHETPPWETSMSGPFDRWPARQGFEKFYGFIGGEKNLFRPYLVDGTTELGVPRDPNYHFNVDITDKAIGWIRGTRSLTPDRPFFMYYATGGAHPPHTPPKEWLDVYKGKFDQGWDKLRGEILARQIKMGLMPPGTKIAENPPEIPKWDALSDDAKKVLSRQMEVYAGYAEHTDREIGRLIDAIGDLGELDNTIVIYIAGDNGGTAIGGLNGTFNEWSNLNDTPEDIPYLKTRMDEYGGPNSYPNYSVAWAMAGSTPATWCINACQGGGQNQGMVIRWPGGIKSKGEIRRQYTHLIDVGPTILEAVGIPEPKIVNGVEQIPMAGTSMIYSFDDAAAKDRHTVQYNECSGNRSIYKDGWMACVMHRAPWESSPRVDDYAKDKWELYNVAVDFGQATDLAAQNPAKLKELQDLFHQEAIKFGVYPMDDRSFARLNATNAGRPDIMAGRTEVTYYAGMTGMAENVFIDTLSRSYVVTADLVIPKGGANGVVVSQGGLFGGWSLYVKDGRPKLAYNWLAREKYFIEGKEALPEGKVTLVYDFTYDGGGLHKGGTGVLSINGRKVGEGRINKTQGAVWSLAGETADIGVDAYSPVCDDYDPWENAFTGTINTVKIKHKA
ncbi:arylsulfatase A-like enzyme [Bradyrhizobium sp. JR7.2]|uniref:arylsulfatase n=1 Tax=unclassified Bradyrhizobium TaxID=2631580 RepID=UPI00339B287E